MKGIKEILIAPVVIVLVLAYTQPAFAPPPGTGTSTTGTYPTTPTPDKTTDPRVEPGRTSFGGETFPQDTTKKEFDVLQLPVPGESPSEEVARKLVIPSGGAIVAVGPSRVKVYDLSGRELSNYQFHGPIQPPKDPPPGAPDPPDVSREPYVLPPPWKDKKPCAADEPGFGVGVCGSGGVCGAGTGCGESRPQDRRPEGGGKPGVPHADPGGPCGAGTGCGPLYPPDDAPGERPGDPRATSDQPLPPGANMFSPGGTTTTRITNVRGNANVTVGFPEGTTTQKMPNPPWVVRTPGRTIIIMPVAEDVGGEALATLVANKLRGTLHIPQTQGDARYRPAEPDVPPEIVLPPRGPVVIRTPEGEWTLKGDGTLVQKSDGTTITFYPDGRIVTETKGGAVYEENPDGSTRTTEADGTVTEVSADGKRTVTKPQDPK